MIVAQKEVTHGQNSQNKQDTIMREEREEERTRGEKSRPTGQGDAGSKGDSRQREGFTGADYAALLRVRRCSSR